MQTSIDLDSKLALSRNANDVKGLDLIRQAAKNGDKEALEEAAKQFEAIFVKMMLSSMRKAQDVLADEDSPFNSQQVKFYRDMHDQQLATDLSDKGTLGLADIIVRQLGQMTEGYLPASAIRDNADVSSLNRHAVSSTEQAQNNVVSKQEVQTFASFKTAAFADANRFIQSLYPVAEKAAEALGIEPKALIAQAAVETGWGQHMIHTVDGKNSYNLFGIKADRRWQGDRAIVDTVEVDKGVAKTQKAPFRIYTDFTESMKDYVNFVGQNPRYEKALSQADSPKDYFSELQKAGYATDPNYADKILSVLNSPRLQGYSPR